MQQEIKTFNNSEPSSNFTATDLKRERPFSFLFEGVFAQGLNAYELIRLGVILCLSINLFGIEIFGSRAQGSLIGVMLGKFGGLLYYFNLYLWIPLTILFGLMQIKRRAIRLGPLLLAIFWPLGLLLFLYISVQTSEAPYVADHRWERFVTLALPCILNGIVLVDPKSMRLVRDTFLVFAASKAVAFILAPQGMIVVLQGQSLGISAGYISQLVLENNEIRTGYELGFMILTAIMISRTALNATTTERWGLYSLAAFQFFLLLLNGTRGALAALVAGFAVLWMIQKGKLRIRAAGLLIAMLVAGLAGFSIMDNLFSKTKQRYLFAFSEHSSLWQRVEYSSEALAAEMTLLGRGVGSFGADRTNEFNQFYTHNAFSEMYYEGGLIGLMLLTLSVLTALRRLWHHAKLTNDPATVFCLCGLIFFFIFTQFSGYLLSHAGFWLFLSCGPSCVALSKKGQS